jgi:cyclophilin family peptidyl-prolyl cis-trans isomerase
MRMRWLALKLRESFGHRDPHRRGRHPSRRPPRRHLELERLEDRAVPTANVADALTGTAFVDHNGTGVFGPGDGALSGLTVTLTGTSFKGTSITATTTTQANGSFQFLSVPKGTYQLTAGSVNGFLGSSLSFGNVQGPAGVNVVSGVAVAPGQNTTARFSMRGLDPRFISLDQFLSSTTAADLPTGLAGPGSAAASGPFVKAAIGNVPLSSGNTTDVINLLGTFGAPDLGTSMVHLDTNKGRINLQLFDGQAPQNVQNFIDYIQGPAGSNYTNTIFHRRTKPQDGLEVVQGGGFTFTTGSGGTTLPALTPFGAVADEVGLPNTPGTLSFAKTGAANSGTDEFFFNLSDNTQVLGPRTASNPDGQENGGFTVFGKIADAASQNVVNALAFVGDNKFTNIHNESTFNGAMNEIPLTGFADNDANFPKNATTSNLGLVTAAKVDSRNEVLTFSATSSNTAVATVSIGSSTPERLTVTRVAAGTATITVTATDQFGNTASTTFKVTVT